MLLSELLGDAYKEGMSLEEIETAIAEITLPEDQSDEVTRLKAALSKSNSEAAGYKKQLREKLSEGEKKAEAEAEERRSLQEQYDTLLKEVQLSKYKAELIDLGYDKELAQSTAEAIASGNTAEFFKNQKTHQEKLKKQIKAEALKDSPKPVGGSGSSSMTLAQFRALSPAERYEFSTKNPEQYRALYEGSKK